MSSNWRIKQNRHRDAGSTNNCKSCRCALLAIAIVSAVIAAGVLPALLMMLTVVSNQQKQGNSASATTNSTINTTITAPTNMSSTSTNTTAATSAATTSAATTSAAATTVSSTIVTNAITSTSGTTTITCLTGYVPTSSGSCVNTQIDFNNCGSIGYVCSSNYTSCAAGVCSSAPAVQLPNGVAVSGWGGLTSIDDAFQTISIPFYISMYNYSSANVSVTSNGVVCLGGCSTAFTNGILPSSNFDGPTAFAYWDDLMIYSGTAETVYYSIEGTAPNRSLVFEFYESHFGTPNEYYHFQVVFYENLPGIVQYIYFQSSDGGVSATIGVQESGTGTAMTYSVNQPSMVTSNMTLTFDTNTGTYTG